MLVINIDTKNNTIEMINVSSTKGKEKRLIYDSNISINNYYPLHVPSFAKLKTLYKLYNVKEAENCISFNGIKLDKNELNNIKNEREKYIKKHKDANIIKFSNKDFINSINRYKNIIKIEITRSLFFCRNKANEFSCGSYITMVD